MTHHLVVTQNITVDGRIEFLDDWFQPSPDSGFEDLHDEMQRQGSETAAMLLGRRTFEDFRESVLATNDPPSPLTFRAGPRRVVVQGHCHQRSLVGLAPMLRLLKRIPDAQVMNR